MDCGGNSRRHNNSYKCLSNIVDIIDFKMSPEDAVNKPKFHHQWLPDVFFVENNFNKNVMEDLEKMGYKISERSAIGRTEVIMMQPNGTMIAVGDSRGEDAGVGY